MNPHDDLDLETLIHRELKALPHLRAPRSLAPRVMAALEARQHVPWYRQAWQNWPMPLQAASLVALLVAFAGLCVGGWQIAHLPAVVSATNTAGNWFGALNAVWRSVGVLVNAIATVFSSLGPWVVLACVLALLAGYATCVGLGTMYVRFALARR